MPVSRVLVIGGSRIGRDARRIERIAEYDSLSDEYPYKELCAALCREAGVSVHVIDESKYDTYALISRALSLARSVQSDVIHARRQTVGQGYGDECQMETFAQFRQWQSLTGS